MASKLSHLAYEHIQRKLLTDRLPIGAKVSEQILARELGISRTPVREAIRRLQSEGVLYQVPSSGTFVAQPDRAQLIEAYEVREALECFATGKAARKMVPKQRTELTLLAKKMLAAIRAFRDSGDPLLDGEPLREFLTADLAFHLLLLKSACNHSVMKMVADVHMRNRVFGYRTHRRDLHHLSWVWLVHARIARAVRKHDAKRARYWMRRHIRASLRDALAAFDKQLASQMAGRSAPMDLAEAMDALVARLTQVSEVNGIVKKYPEPTIFPVGKGGEDKQHVG